MFKRSSAPAALTVGLMLASIAVTATYVQLSGFSASSLEKSSAVMLDTGQVGDSMRPRVAASLATMLPAGSTLGGVNLDATADAMLQDPAFEQAFAGALGAISKQVFAGEKGTITLDPTLVQLAATSTIARLDPTLAGVPVVVAGAPITIDTDPILDAGGLDEAVRVAATGGWILGLVLIVLGFFLSEKRLVALARIGRWTAVTGITMLFFFWMLPRFALPRVGGWTEVIGVVMDAGGIFFIPSLAMIGAGLAINFAANRMISLDRSHTLAVIPKSPMRHATADDKNWRTSA